MFLVLPVMLVINFSTTASAEWFFGIGTGIYRLNAQGDQGLHTNLLGPVTFDVDLSPDDIDDLMETAFGLGGYATNGKWMIQASFAMLELVDTVGTTLPGGTSLSAEIGFEATTAQVIIGYPIYYNESLLIRAHAGARYIGHEVSADLSATGANGTFRLVRTVEEDWTDVLLGLTADVPLAEKWTWSTRVDAGFGGSDGTYFGETGVNWQFHKNWSLNLYGNYLAIEFEEGHKGDPGWYIYDADEFGVGLNILFHWGM